MRLDAHQMRAIADAVEQLNRRFDNYVTARKDAENWQYSGKKEGSGYLPVITPGPGVTGHQKVLRKICSTREEAVAAARAWHEQQRGDAGVFEAARHARDKAGQFAKKVGAAVAKGAKTAAGTLIDPIGNKTGEQKFNQFRRQKTLGNKARGIGSAATNVASAVGLPLGAWIPASRPNYKKEDKKPKAGLTRDILAPGSPGRKALTAQLAKNKARGEHVAKVVQQTMRGK